jgi:hypothetical protein
MAREDMQLIGRTTLISLSGIADVPAKVDTGADSSSIWASNIRVADGELRFTLFAESSPFYSAEHIALGSGLFNQVRVASSSGHRQARYAVSLPVKIAGVKVQARFTLTNRETMLYPVLLGRDVLMDRFVVDVSQAIPVRLQETLKEQKRLRMRAIRVSKRKKEAGQ